MFFFGLMVGGLFSSASAADIQAVAVQDVNTYTGSEPYVYDLPTKKYFVRNSAEKYEEYGLVVNVDALNTTTTYEGKLVILSTDNHEYKFTGGVWTDCGSAAGQSIADTNYQNMNNWTCRFGYATTYDNIENTNGNDNFFNPYKGEGGWEPYQVKITGLTIGDNYRFSFNFTSEGWKSWDDGAWAALPVFVTNNWDFPQNNYYPTVVDDQVLGFVHLPKAAVTDEPYSISFIADATEETIAINFGVVDDSPEYKFHFDNLLVERIGLPENYTATLEYVVADDPNFYTPLAYIEGKTQARANTFTLPYIANKNTEVDVKFQSYSGGDWRAIFSGRNGSDAGTGISLYQNGNQTKFGYFVGGFKEDNFADYPGHNQDITVKASLAGLIVNDNAMVTTGRTEFYPSTRRISLFANPEWDQAFRGRIYYATLKENGVTVMDFQPVMRHDGAVGYYDSNYKMFVQPVQGSYQGYDFKTLDDQKYLYYAEDTRIVIVGATAKYLPTINTIGEADFNWSSADPTIATVTADGTVEGVKAGKVVITATTDADNGWTASYELTVSEPNYVRHDANSVGYAVIIGGNSWGDSPVSALVDNDARTKFGTSDVADAWAILIASEPVAVKQYSIVTGSDTYDYVGRTPRSWKLEGSNDNLTWTTIDEQTQNYKAKTSNMEETVFTVNGAVAYKFFKLSCDQFDGGFQLGEFWINEQVHTWGDVSVTASTCTKAGKNQWECTDCHALKTEELPLAAHNYENGVCTVCGEKLAEPVLLYNGATNPYTAKFRHMVGSDNTVDIEAGWNTASFDDSAWDELLLPVGTFGPYKTRWMAEYNTFWFRRTFEVDAPSAITKLTLKAVHDDDYIVFVNGTQVDKHEGWTNGENDWRVIEVPTSLLVEGKNVLAVYVEQNFGGAYFDCSLEATYGDVNRTLTNGYATFSGAKDYAITTDGVKAYRAVESATPGYIRLEEVGTDIPANTGVVLFGEGKDNVTLEVTTGAAAVGSNMLHANVVDYALPAESDGCKNYTLGLDPDDSSVCVFRPSSGEGLLAAGKAYLAVPNGGGAKYGITFGDETGVNETLMKGYDASAPIFNLQGQRVNSSYKGVVVVGGKKFTMK